MSRSSVDPTAVVFDLNTLKLETNEQNSDAHGFGNEIYDEFMDNVDDNGSDFSDKSGNDFYEIDKY